MEIDSFRTVGSWNMSRQVLENRIGFNFNAGYARDKAIFEAIVELREKVETLEMNVRGYTEYLHDELKRLRWVLEGSIGDQDMQDLRKDE